MESAKCPICSTNMRRLRRYPLAICSNCVSQDDVKDVSGNHVEFINTSMWGGFASIHKIEGMILQKDEHICFVKGVKCYAEEGYFGGIIIQLYDSNRIS